MGEWGDDGLGDALGWGTVGGWCCKGVVLLLADRLGYGGGWRRYNCFGFYSAGLRVLFD